MISNKVQKSLEKAGKTFQREGKTEEGLDVDSGELLQLRKSCRLLEAVNELESIDGYHTLIIEASFSAIERAIQSYLIEKDVLDTDETISRHEKIYEKGCNPGGLYGENIKDELVELWRENRSKIYYREGIGTEEKAEAMKELAEEFHRYILGLSENSYKCICSD